MLHERGIDATYEKVRRWISKFGPQIARNLRRRQERLGDIWHLDEVVVTCAGKKFWLWRAVDQHATVLEEILQKRRDKRAAMHLLVALLKRYGFVPKRIIIDELRSYGAAKAIHRRALPKTDQSVLELINSSPSVPSQLLPIESSAGDHTAIEAQCGTTARIPPPTPDLAGNPTR
jgi:transposase-like protein